MFCYLEMINGSINQVQNPDFSTVQSTINTILGIFFLILSFLTPFCVYLFLLINFHKLNQLPFLKKYSSLYYEVKQNKIQTILYYYYYFIRRFVYIINLALLYPFPIVQSIFNILFSLGFLAYLVNSRCFKNAKEMNFNILCELSVLASTIICSSYLFDLSEKTSTVLEYLCLAIGATVTFVNLSLSVHGFLDKMLKFRRDKLVHGPTFAAHKNLPSLAVLHISSMSGRAKDLEEEIE